MIELIYLFICTPGVMFAFRIITGHKAMSYDSKILQYNYSLVLYITLAIWWLIASCYFLTSVRVPYGESITYAFAGQTWSEIVAMVIGYAINVAYVMLGMKETRFEWGMFKTPSQEARDELEERIREDMMRDAVKREIERQAKKEIEENLKVTKTPGFISEESIPKGVIVDQGKSLSLKELAE